VVGARTIRDGRRNFAAYDLQIEAHRLNSVWRAAAPPAHANRSKPMHFNANSIWSTAIGRQAKALAAPAN
jgi:hypothetical protein